MFVTFACANALATPFSDPEVEVTASALLGWLEYRDLWVGDPLLGAFDGQSSPFVADRALASAAFGLTWWASDRHRLRVRLDSRALSRATVVKADGTLGAVVTSDGVPLSTAVRERAFFDEASWRFRPLGHRGVELRAGILPFEIASGRFLAESWPGLSVSVEGARLGGPPLTVDLRGAVTTAGAKEAALTVSRRWSAFDAVGLELAGLWDPRGLAPAVEADPGLLLGVFGEANRSFIGSNVGPLASWLDATYLRDPYGLALLQADATTYLDLTGRGTLGYASFTGQGVLGNIRFDGAVIFGFGAGSVYGNRLPGTAWATPPADWANTAPRERWTRSWRMRSLAFDAWAERLGTVAPFAFVQGASGDPDLVATVTEDQTIGAFVAPDQRFVRTRLFPVDAARRGGAWSLPPGVGSYGLVAVGAGLGLTVGGVVTRTQVAVPWSVVPTCLGCGTDGSGAPVDARRHQGVEGDVRVGWRWGVIAPVAEVGVFRAGRFFLDDSDPSRDQVGDLPIGWRTFVGVGLSARRAGAR